MTVGLGYTLIMAFGVMFHHFHSHSHAVRPGSLSESEFEDMIRFLLDNFQILTPVLFLERLESGSLSGAEVVLTFDDSLLSQFEVAIPVLEKYGLQGIFFINSSVASGAPDSLEVFAHFRSSQFSSFEQFWAAFLDESDLHQPGIIERTEAQFPADWLSEYSFYSLSERKFRFLRDIMLESRDYVAIMNNLIRRYPSFEVGEVARRLWMRDEHLAELVHLGHEIGLHSHSHPTRMEDLEPHEQRLEYETNRNWIRSELGIDPRWVAHPCGSYSRRTLEILTDMGIKVGFKDSIGPGRYGSNLEIQREDSTNIANLYS